jgi:hypothetical protein
VCKGVYGTISDENRAQCFRFGVQCTGKKSIRDSAGIGNIFKVFRIDFLGEVTISISWSNRFTVKGSFGFNF